jgi:hypothetical protein
MVDTVKPLPPLKRFEHFPQVLGRKDSIHDNMYQRIGMRKVMLTTDGHITAGTPEMEFDSQREFGERHGLPVYAVGYDPAEGGATDKEKLSTITEVEQDINPRDKIVIDFMNDMHVKFGASTLAYARYVSVSPWSIVCLHTDDTKLR